MLERIDAYSTQKQNRLRRDTMLYNLAIWFLQVAPGAAKTNLPEALFGELRNAVDRRAAHIPMTEFALIAQYAAALVCLGHDFESYYPAAGAVLQSKALSQMEKAQWLEQYMNAFAHLRGEGFKVPPPQLPLPPELWPRGANRY